MKKFIASICIILLSLASLHAQEFKPYLSESEVKNSVQLLPPPPQEGSVEFLMDQFAHWEYFRLRTADPVRARQAVDDANMNDIGLKFADAFGLEITREKMPQTYELVMRSRECFGSSGCSAAKSHYNRARPFVYFSCPTLTPEAESWLRTNGSYPSGHTANFFGIAYVLAELRPERAAALLERANEGGISRLIVGVHWASDVAAGRMVAASVYEYLKDNPEYRAQFKKAQAEVQKALQKAADGKPQPYLKADELPDATVFLPAPPEDGSPMLASDTLMYQYAKRHLRMNTRGMQAIREGTTDVDTMALLFSDAFGYRLSDETTPKTLHLLRRSIRTFRLSASAPKAAYMRLRPFVYYREPTLIPAYEEEERHTGSYPSGHSVRGWGMALVLAALNPPMQDAILLEGYEWGQSRVIAGYHWQSDVDASRNLASACFARMQENDAYQKDFEAARSELQALGIPREKQLEPAGNPIITHMYSADPSAHVFGDSLYVYPSHDRDKALNFDMEDYHCYVTGDMKTFHDRGVIFHPAKQTSWAKDRAWAPDCVERNGKYYLYYPTDVRHIGVAVSDSPYGPFKDPLGHPLLSIDSPGVICDRDFIDPCVFIDDDGQAYMFVGQNTVCCIKLNEDMISYDGQVHIIQGAEGFFEAAWVHKYNGKYYLSYSSSGLNGNRPEIVYAMADTPLGPYEYKGRILGPVNSGTNHHSIVQYKGDWYLFYHTADLAIRNWPMEFGKWFFHRSVCVNRLFYKDDGTIQEVFPTVSAKKLETNTAFKEAY